MGCWGLVGKLGDEAHGRQSRRRQQHYIKSGRLGRRALGVTLTGSSRSKTGRSRSKVTSRGPALGRAWESRCASERRKKMGTPSPTAGTIWLTGSSSDSWHRNSSDSWHRSRTRGTETRNVFKVPALSRMRPTSQMRTSSCGAPVSPRLRLVTLCTFDFFGRGTIVGRLPNSWLEGKDRPAHFNNFQAVLR